MFFRKTKELQSLVNVSRKALEHTEKELDLAYSQIDNRDKIIYKQKEKIDKQKDLINRIENLLSANKYNNEKVVLDKIKELVSDYQSIN